MPQMTTQPLIYDLAEVRNIIEEYDTVILESLGLSPDKYGNVTTCCPVHGGDNETAFTYKAKIKKWGCWTHQCHSKTSSDLIGLIQGLKRYSFQDAIRYIMEITGKVVGEVSDINELQRKLFIRNKLRGMEGDEPEKIFDKTLLGHLDPNVEYFIGRGFQLQTLKDFAAFYCDNMRKPLYGRACLTIFNANDDIIGFTGRKTKTIDPADDNKQLPKWKHMPLDIKTTRHLFGLNRAKKYIKDTGTAILVEGPLDTMRMHEAGFYQTVSTFGNNFSTEQRQLLMKHGAKTVIMAFDPDTGGDIGTANIIQNARLFFNTYDIREFLDNDPGDLPPNVLAEKLKGEVDRIVQYERTKYD